MRTTDKIKIRIASILGEGIKHGKGSETFDLFIEILVLANVAAIILESIKTIDSVYDSWFEYFEFITVVIFSLEFLLRAWVCDIRFPGVPYRKALLKFLKSPYTWVDLLAIAPFFIPLVVDIDLRHLRIFRLTRLLRIFKLIKYLQSMQLIGRIISEKKQELLATLLLTFSILVVASTLMFHIEREVQPDKFSNVLYSFWWGIATLTTVGYGDIYPITPLGKTLGALVAVMGVMIVAIPTGIISSSFVQKMDEAKNKKRLQNIRQKLKEAFYKKYIPELACKVRRGQLSVDAVKVNLELAEHELYKIAEGKNEFRFRYVRVNNQGSITDKLFLEYREINKGYGTFTDRKSNITLVSPESLNKQGIGYLVYCLSERLKSNYISNEFYGDEADVHEESFGDKGLELSAAFNFRHNKAYFQKIDEPIPVDFTEWKYDLEKLRKPHSMYVVFNALDNGGEKGPGIHLTYQLSNNTHSIYNEEKAQKLGEYIKNRTKERFQKHIEVTHNGRLESIKENNILTYISEQIKTECIAIHIHKDFLQNENLFALAAILADGIKEELVGLPQNPYTDTV